ncbi:hypothetical protein BDN71DRAFT_1457202 [Pleurotus eryngii]|uniref:Uncharacterized protein n=1 Tax=Pleurotus eryngii TaxID=5323 RepID=A0A9P5ZHM8_PLEER|nr:hypothetical protein BDN71DRAFT_1457202 [Pleurotus eryngii]
MTTACISPSGLSAPSIPRQLDRSLAIPHPVPPITRDPYHTHSKPTCCPMPPHPTLRPEVISEDVFP